MTQYTYTIETDIQLPHIIIERQYNSNVHTAYRLTPEQGYVLHDPERDLEVYDPTTGESFSEKQYFPYAVIPTIYNFNTWTWEAVSSN